ncbi:MAG: hypothetical protein FWD49_03200 [Firmicutes bacterium]|nr:hypothetical protein [Bacillota bacterium]
MDSSAKTEGKFKLNKNFKRLFFPVLSLVIVLAFIFVVVFAYAWYVDSVDPRTNRGLFLTKNFDIVATVSVSFNGEDIQLEEVDSLPLVVGDILEYIVEIESIDEKILGFGVYLEGVTSNMLTIEKTGGGYYQMSDMYQMAYYDTATGDFSAYAPVSAFPATASGIKVFSARRASANEDFVIRFRIAFFPPDSITETEINQLQNQKFSFTAIRLTQENT